MQLQVTNMFGLPWGPLPFSETSQETYNHKYYDETKQRALWQSEAKLQENHKPDHDELEDIDNQAPAF